MIAQVARRAPDGQHQASRPGLESNATLVARVDWTRALATLTVRPDGGPPTFEPGQYFALGLVVDGRLLQRPYSTATGPGSGGDLEFLVRLVERGAFTPRLWALEPGARLRIGRPKGLFTRRPNDPRTHLFIATGSGLAPCLSMLDGLGANRASESIDPGRQPHAVLIHGVASVAELAYRARLEGLAADPARLAYEPVISRAIPTGWAGRTGRLGEHLDELCRIHGLLPGSTVAYVCGNPGMVATVERSLAARGFARDAIVSEQYWPGEPDGCGASSGSWAP